MPSTSRITPALPLISSAWGSVGLLGVILHDVLAKVIAYMLVSGGREPFWDGSDVRAIKNTLKKEVENDIKAYVLKPPGEL